MLAKRPETRTGSGSGGARATASVAAAWLLGGLLLVGSSPANAAEAADAAPAAGAPKTAAQPQVQKAAPAEVARGASDSSFVTPGAGSANAAAPTQVGAKNAPASGAPSAKSAPATGAGRAASRPATVPTVRAGRGVAPPPGSRAPGQTAVAPGGTRGVQAISHLDQKLTYQYNALGRRDPFAPMVGGEFIGADVGGDAPVDVGGMRVVGIVWGTEDKFAMVEDGRGQSLVLRVGDKVMNGVVESLKRDAVVIRITTDGQSQSVSIPLTRKGEKSNANR